MDYRIRLLLLAETYAAATNRSVPRIATLIRNDGKFFAGLKQGRGCTVDTYEDCLQWFSNNWPPDLRWPTEAVARPEPDAAAKAGAA